MSCAVGVEADCTLDAADGAARDGAPISPEDLADDAAPAPDSAPDSFDPTERAPQDAGDSADASAASPPRDASDLDGGSALDARDGVANADVGSADAGASGDAASRDGDAALAAANDADAAEAADAHDANITPPADAGFQIAPHPAPPQIVYRGGGVLAHPKLVSVTYDDYDLRDQVDGLLSSLGSSGDLYWAQGTQEYGVGPATSQLVHLAGSAPQAADDLDVRAWLDAHLDGAHALPAPADDPVFVFFFPSTTRVTVATLIGCQGFYGYHDAHVLNGGPWAGQRVAYAVIPECTAGLGASYNTTSTASHEILESVTDPFGTPQGQGLGYHGVDADHKIWELLRGGEGEVGDLCEGIYLPNMFPVGYGYFVQRTWSNRAALAGTDPCVPGLPGAQPYFNAAPELTDTVTIRMGAATYLTKGLKLPLNGEKTILVRLFSDRPTEPWSVSASDLSPVFGAGPRLTFSWSASSGQNGSVLALTIKYLAGTSRFGGAPFMITSHDGIRRNEWFGYVASD